MKWGADYDNVASFSDVQSLSHSDVLRKIFQLKDGIQEFMTAKDKSAPGFNDLK